MIKKVNLSARKEFLISLSGLKEKQVAIVRKEGSKVHEVP